MTASEKYVAAAYLVVFLFVLAYVLIIGSKLQRLEREVADLAELARRKVEAPEEELVVG
jgi:CcmD family protein